MSFAASRSSVTQQPTRVAAKPAATKVTSVAVYNENAHKVARKEGTVGTTTTALKDISNTAASRPVAAKPASTRTAAASCLSAASFCAAPLLTSTVVPFGGGVGGFGGAAAQMPECLAIDADESEEMSVDSMANMSLEDIDEFDRDDPQFVTDYVKEIFTYLRVKEAEDRVRFDYMNDQRDLRPTHRHILVNWMAEVYVKFSLLSETMFMAVNIIDRFLSMRQVSRGNFQLVGITAMLIACKYEEIYAPQVKDFLYVCDRAYEADDVLRMEQIILTTLDFNLATPSPLHFLRRFSKAGRADSKTHTLSKYLTELTMCDYSMIKYLPSEIAAAAVYVARRMREISPRWNSTLRFHTQYDEAHVVPIARELNSVLAQANAKPTAVVRKYSSSRLLSVAKITPVSI